MQIRLYVKGSQVCYSSRKEKDPLDISPKQYTLVELGWKEIGKITGWNISCNFPTMTDILRGK